MPSVVDRRCGWNTDRRAWTYYFVCFHRAHRRARSLIEVFDATRTAYAIILLGGEAGVGKTRLVSEFIGHVPEAQVMVGASPGHHR